MQLEVSSVLSWAKSVWAEGTLFDPTPFASSASRLLAILLLSSSHPSRRQPIYIAFQASRTYIAFSFLAGWLLVHIKRAWSAFDIERL
ncbi:hypothetical protein BC832DRAFT_545866 [Gaertneriomyces semiglobifer]|nr:hypothetical protein BC832DRAFT_545866 [Gaertneriomyces semiglobifer]